MKWASKAVKDVKLCTVVEPSSDGHFCFGSLVCVARDVDGCLAEVSIANLEATLQDVVCSQR